MRHEIARAAGARAEAHHRTGDSAALSRAKRRWFAAKDRKVRVDRHRARRCHPRARAGRVHARRDRGHDGRPAGSLLPAARHRLGRREPPAARAQLALARVRRRPAVGFLTDAFAVDRCRQRSWRPCGGHARKPLARQRAALGFDQPSQLARYAATRRGDPPASPPNSLTAS